MAYYEQDPEENAQLARAMLNMSISKNPNQPEVEEVLDVLRRNVIIHNIIYIVLPIVGVFSLGIFLLLRYEKKQKKQEKDMIYNESKDDDDL
jgi:ATP-dependent Zn protease